VNPSSFEDHQAFFRCPAINQDGWIPKRDIRLPVDDLGFRQGVTAVERLRTYGGKPHRVDLHLQRLRFTLDHLGIISQKRFAEREREPLRQQIHELLLRNSDLIDSQVDVGITIWVTPGSVAAHFRDENSTANATDLVSWSLCLNPLDHLAVEQRRTKGQPLVMVDVSQPPVTSWSRHAKVRCRLHYYRADQLAKQAAPEAIGLLRDGDGSWTETSVANIAIVREGAVVVPPTDQVLNGVTLAWTQECAKELGVAWSERRLFANDLIEADEILLMGTDTGLWFANEVWTMGETANAPGGHRHGLRSPADSGVLRSLQQRMYSAT